MRVERALNYLWLEGRPQIERVAEVATRVFALLGLELSLLFLWGVFRFPLTTLVLGPLIRPYLISLLVLPLLFGCAWGWWRR